LLSGTTLSRFSNTTGLSNIGAIPAICWIEPWVLIIMWQMDKLVLIMTWQVDKLVLIMMWRGNYPKQKKKEKEKINKGKRGQSPCVHFGGSEKSWPRGVLCRVIPDPEPPHPPSQREGKGEPPRHRHRPATVELCRPSHTPTIQKEREIARVRTGATGLARRRLWPGRRRGRAARWPDWRL